MNKKLPDFHFEKSLWRKGYIVIGVDEVGRGALAGPLYVGAVCFYKDDSTKISPQVNSFKESDSSDIHFRRNFVSSSVIVEHLGIDDSKKLSAKNRERLAKIIKKQALAYSISCVSSSIINRFGIVEATKKAIRKAVKSIVSRINNTKIFLLVDAFYVKHIRSIGLRNQLAIVHGDEKSISIAAASIVAKVARDDYMINLSKRYKLYRWQHNKGYGTKKHIEAIKKYGKLKFHRELFLRKISRDLSVSPSVDQKKNKSNKQ